MNHLFIINPAAEKMRDQTNDLINNIDSFFKSYGSKSYKIFVTKAPRDAMGYIPYYSAKCKDILRVHAIGGTGTLSEVVNGSVGLPNMQISNYPLGRNNSFIKYFGENNLHLFKSIKTLVSSPTVSVDLIKCDKSYGIAYCAVGFESSAERYGKKILERAYIPFRAPYWIGGIYSVIKDSENEPVYNVVLDGEPVEGNFFTFFAANTPANGMNRSPAAGARPNDGYFDVYMGRQSTGIKMLSHFHKYCCGKIDKTQGCFTHAKGKKMKITSNAPMSISIDGETYSNTKAEYEIVTGALDFVCPSGINFYEITADL